MSTHADPARIWGDTAREKRARTERTDDEARAEIDRLRAGGRQDKQKAHAPTGRRPHLHRWADPYLMRARARDSTGITGGKGGWAYLRRVLRLWRMHAQAVRQPGYDEAREAARDGTGGGMLLEGASCPASRRKP